MTRASITLVIAALVFGFAQAGASTAPATQKFTPPKVRVVDLPREVQRDSLRDNVDCGARLKDIERLSYAYVFKEHGRRLPDYVRLPGEGVENVDRPGDQGPCDDNDGPPFYVWSPGPAGAYHEVHFDPVFDVLILKGRYVFMTWCGGDMTEPEAQLVIVRPGHTRPSPFGRCFKTADEAEAFAKAHGYQEVALP